MPSSSMKFWSGMDLEVGAQQIAKKPATAFLHVHVDTHKYHHYSYHCLFFSSFQWRKDASENYSTRGKRQSSQTAHRRNQMSDS